jgi:acetyltransferase
MRPGRQLDPLFRPRRVALVGASDREGSPGAVLWANLTTFPGEVVPVSATALEVDGVPAFRSLREIPGPVDLAVVAVPAAACPRVVREAAEVGVRCCVVVSAGFAETGEHGRALQEEMLAAARSGGVLLVGPNCLGVQNLGLPLNASLAAGTARGGTGISLVTQSGSYAMAVQSLSADEGVRFATAYSSGNRADLGDHEVIEHLRDDPATDVICVYLESVAGGRALLDAIRSTTARKPVVVTAVGRSEAGARAAASHTAALATDRRAWDSLLASVGATVARSGREMLDAAQVLAGQPLPGGDRVGVVTNSGGIGTELADLLVAEGLQVPRLSEGLQRRLAALLPPYAGTSNPVDITPVWRRFAELYPAVLDLLARSGEVDMVVPVLLHRSAENPAVGSGLIETVAALRREGLTLPVVACWVAARAAWPRAAALREAGMPCLEWPPRTASAVGHAVRYARYRGSVQPIVLAATPRRLPVDVGHDSRATWEFLRASGLPLAETAFCATADEAASAARRLGHPVVVKVDHPDISHKTDVGGVRTGLRNEQQVLTAARELLTLAGGSRVVVQHQHAGVELVVGALQEPTFGPVVCFGTGGVLLEVTDDVVFAPAPLSGSDALALLDRPRASRLLDGLRGAAPVDRATLASVVQTAGDLVADHAEIGELDLNPVLGAADRCVVVDVRLVRADVPR